MKTYCLYALDMGLATSRKDIKHNYQVAKLICVIALQFRAQFEDVKQSLIRFVITYMIYHIRRYVN